MSMISTKQTKKIDSLGRITIPKSIRAELNYNSNDTMEFFRCEDADGIYIGMRKIEESAETAEMHDNITVKVLTDLGCEIPTALSDRIASRIMLASKAEEAENENATEEVAE